MKNATAVEPRCTCRRSRISQSATGVQADWGDVTPRRLPSDDVGMSDDGSALGEDAAGVAGSQCLGRDDVDTAGVGHGDGALLGRALDDHAVAWSEHGKGLIWFESEAEQGRGQCVRVHRIRRRLRVSEVVVENQAKVLGPAIGASGGDSDPGRWHLGAALVCMAADTGPRVWY